MSNTVRRVLWVGDGVDFTGFGVVNTNIISNLPKEKYEIHHIGINYRGDPHEFHWKIYPASLAGDLWGFGRLEHFKSIKFDFIFILNDAWVISKYLEKIKEHFDPVPPIVVYFPVDSLEFDKTWFKDYDIVTKAVVYTKFGYDVVKECMKTGNTKQKAVRNAGSDIELEIIPHGVDTKIFYKMEEPKREIKKRVYPDKEEFLDSFIVLNANRNQVRKRVDIAIKGFALFSEGKPENVKYYHHAGLKDAGFDVVKLVNRLGMTHRFIVTNNTINAQHVTPQHLNLIYNATDVGINTGTGEGWGLTTHEHAATGAPQIVADHSALHELYEDCGLLIPISYWTRNPEQLTMSGLVRPEDVAEKLNEIYYGQDLFESLSRKSYLKFTSEEYTWASVGKQWDKLFDTIG
jgi:D-inositol-3-phosphate glycosyltransferase